MPRRWIKRGLVACSLVFVISLVITAYPPLTNNTATVTVVETTPDYVNGEIVFYDEASDEQRLLFDRVIEQRTVTATEDATHLQEHMVLVKNGEAYVVGVHEQDSILELWSYAGLLISGVLILPALCIGVFKGLSIARRRIRLR